MRRHWYFITIYTCPVCGHEEVVRERQYTKRPKNWEDRHHFVEIGCAMGGGCLTW